MELENTDYLKNDDGSQWQREYIILVILNLSSRLQ